MFNLPPSPVLPAFGLSFSHTCISLFISFLIHSYPATSILSSHPEIPNLPPSPVPGQGSPPLLTSSPYTDYIMVTLVPPEYPNGVITQYNIRWYREGEVDNAQVVTVPGTQQSYTLSGLTPGTYLVQVCS